MSAHRVFIAGGSGYVGTRLIPLLLDRGLDVHALVRQEAAGRLPRGCHIIEGDPLDGRTFAEQVRGADTFVQLVGVPKPAPWKGAAFRAVDQVSALASLQAARAAEVRHFVYVSVAHPAPIMKAYIAVRRACEEAIRASGLAATLLRPWYILGPGHRWPLLLVPAYRLMARISATREAAIRLGLITIEDMLAALLWAIDHPPAGVRVLDVPELRRLGQGAR